jgi:hypothetical protein
VKAFKIGLLISAAGVMMAYQNCSQVKFAVTSASEAAKLGQTPFHFDSNSKVGGVIGADGYPSENLRIKDSVLASKNFVQDCSKPVLLPDGRKQSRYEFEKAQALAKASADPLNKTIPVEFAVSFGQLDDRLALWAHNRAILTEGNDSKTTFIPVGQKDAALFDNGKASVDAYYTVSHESAKENYIYGKSCFFDTVSIVGDLHQTVRDQDQRYDFITESNYDTRHKIHYMYYGWCDPGTAQQCADANSAYGKGNYGADTYPNRLFGAWPHKEAGAPQIVKLYVADLRDKHFGMANHMVLLPEERQRGSELEMDVKKEIDVKTLFRNRDQVIWNLSNSFKSSSGDVFNGMKGVPQLITNMQLAGASGTLLASQYTPIVVDLGKEGVRTSSVFGGTFFNMAAKSEIVNGVESFDFTQATSWLGGDLSDSISRKPASDDKAIVADWDRAADDGFLVVADADGKVTSSRQMLGDHTIVNGKSYSNGFVALKEMADKNCSAEQTERHYIGPWDGDLYSKKLQVWVDANRNGVVDPGEIKSLKDSGILAINACNIVSAEDHDAFGNGTSLRSAFLFNSANETLTNDEILKRLDTGMTKTGQEASFRLAIDLIFQVDESSTLESSQPVVPTSIAKLAAKQTVFN